MAHYKHKDLASPIGDPKPEKREKKKPTPLKRTAIKKKHRVTGEAQVFAEIWNERPHVCTNCKVSLGNQACAYMFAHIKSKKQRPDLRLEKDNIMLHCLYCHFEYDHGTKEKYKSRFKQ